MLYTSYEGIFKDAGYPCIFNEIELSVEECKRQQCFLVSRAQIKSNRIVNCIYTVSLEKSARLIIITPTTNTRHSGTKYFLHVLTKGFYFSI